MLRKANLKKQNKTDWWPDWHFIHIKCFNKQAENGCSCNYFYLGNQAKKIDKK